MSERPAGEPPESLLPSVMRQAEAFGASLRPIRPMIQQAQQWVADLEIATRPTVERLDKWADGVQAAVQPARDWLDANGDRVIEIMAAVQYAAASGRVENWMDLDEQEWTAALKLMAADDGVPLAWVPPGAVVKALIAASDHEARDAVLLAHSDEIVESAREVVAAITHPELADLRAAVLAGWDAWEAGLVTPAQTTAAACVSEIINARYGFNRFEQFCKELAPLRDSHPETWQLTRLRATAVRCSLSTAVQNTRRRLPGFNRHASVHGVVAATFTRPNAIRGLMLATSAARELQFERSGEWLNGADSESR